MSIVHIASFTTLLLFCTVFRPYFDANPNISNRTVCTVVFQLNTLVRAYTFYIRRRLASGEGIVTLGIRVFAAPRLQGGEGNALYPVLYS